MHSTEQEILGNCDVIGDRGAGLHRQGLCSTMGDQVGGTGEVSQQAQNGQGHEMVESVEQQIVRAVVDGSPADQTAAPAAGAGTDRTASNAPAQDGDRSANRREMRGDLENGHPDVW